MSGKKICSLYLVLISSFLFLSCSAITPTETDAKNYVSLMASEGRLKDAFKVTKLSKTNGQLSGQNQDFYLMEYDIEIECLKSEQGWGIVCNKQGEVKKGTGKVAFEKTENGWRPLSDSFMKYSFFGEQK